MAATKKRAAKKAAPKKSAPKKAPKKRKLPKATDAQMQTYKRVKKQLMRRIIKGQPVTFVEQEKK